MIRFLVKLYCARSDITHDNFKLHSEIYSWMQVSSDLSIIDLDVPFTLSFSISATLNVCINLGVLCFFTWQVLFVAAPVIFLSVRLQVSNPCSECYSYCLGVFF